MFMFPAAAVMMVLMSMPALEPEPASFEFELDANKSASVVVEVLLPNGKAVKVEPGKEYAAPPGLYELKFRVKFLHGYGLEEKEMNVKLVPGKKLKFKLSVRGYPADVVV